ncbi:MAG: RNA pseudouridine synthase [Planctomycetota bacterium]
MSARTAGGPPVVLYEDNHCLCVEKPAGTPTAGDDSGDRSLLDAAKDYIKEKYKKPGDVYLGLVHRLDRPVSGVVLFARTSKAAARLSEQFRGRRAKKTYLAVVAGPGPAEPTLCRDFLKKDRVKNRSRVVPDGTPDGAEAVLDCRTLKRHGDRALLEIRPETGRPHQIRVQLAVRGWPIVGDVKYGGPPLPAEEGGRWIALHAARLEVGHPTRDDVVSTECPLPPYWPF